MNKETWVKHLEETENITRPTNGGSKEAWASARCKHINDNCKACADRIRTRKANQFKREQNEVLRDLCGTSAAAARRDMGI